MSREEVAVTETAALPEGVQPDEVLPEPEESVEGTPASPGLASRVAGWAIFGVLTVLFGYAVWAAVGNLMGIPTAAEMMGLEMSVVGWLWLSIGLAVPVIGYAVALMLSAGRGLWVRALILVAALATVAVLQLDIMNLVGTSTYFQ